MCVCVSLCVRDREIERRVEVQSVMPSLVSENDGAGCGAGGEEVEPVFVRG